MTFRNILTGCFTALLAVVSDTHAADLAFAQGPMFFPQLETLGHSEPAKCQETRSRVYKKWTLEEDRQLMRLVLRFGTNTNNSWELISSLMCKRNQRQCRERYFNYLSPHVNLTTWTPEEDKRLLDLHQQFGNCWKKICLNFSGRSDQNVKNRARFLIRGKPPIRRRSQCDPRVPAFSEDIESPELSPNEVASAKEKSCKPKKDPPSVFEIDVEDFKNKRTILPQMSAFMSDAPAERSEDLDDITSAVELLDNTFFSFGNDIFFDDKF
jgi:hypothetical protein